MAETVSVPDGQKQCTGCKTVQPIDQFPLVGVRAPGKRRAACKSCKRRAARKEHLVQTCDYAELLRRKRNAKHLRRYGLTIEQRNEYIASRGGRCEACGARPEQSFGGSLCIDHDHGCCPTEITCGYCLRGVLCYHCNLAVGYLRDSATTARDLADYLEKNNAGTARRIQKAV